MTDNTYTYRCPNPECSEHEVAKGSIARYDEDVVCGVCGAVTVLDEEEG